MKSSRSNQKPVDYRCIIKSNVKLPLEYERASEEVGLLKSIAAQITIAIENARLQE